MTSVTDNAIAMIESDQMQKRTVASVGRRIKIRPGHATQHHLHSSSFHWQMKLLHQRGVSKRCCTTTTGSWERSSRAFPGKDNASPHGKDERSRGRKKKMEARNASFPQLRFYLRSKVGGSGAVTGQSQSESFPACKAEEALPRSCFVEGWKSFDERETML